MEHPLISVVTVSFNAVRDIEKTILSVINQTYKNIEYIIIDGGSTDGTVDIIKKYADRISYWVSEPDKGIYDAMNKGLDKATGDWINFMNAGDCFWKDETLREVAEYGNLYPDADVLYGDCGYFNSDKVMGPYPFWENEKKFQGIGFCHQGVYFKLPLIKRYKYNLHYSLCADFDLCWRLFQDGKVFRYIPSPLCRFDINGVSYSIKNRLRVVKQNAEIAGCQHSLDYRVAIMKIRLLYMMPKTFQKMIIQHLSDKAFKRNEKDRDITCHSFT